MAEPLPAVLKIPEVSRFINRANQLRTIKPALAYWCEYHAVNQIVGKGLHNSDDEAFEFTKTLIERLETTKTERADDEAIIDNAAGQAYVEQFAQQTFDRAERTLRADKVTRQTADTFDAAATFFDLTREWGEPDPEVVKKIKFAKWNAARILKAIREGKDPNETNPKAPEPEPSVSLDPSDPEVQLLTGGQRATVEDAPEGGESSRIPTPTEAPSKDPTDPSYFPPQTEPEGQAPEPFVPSPMSTSSTPAGDLSRPPVGLPPDVSPAVESPAQPATNAPSTENSEEPTAPPRPMMPHLTSSHPGKPPGMDSPAPLSAAAAARPFLPHLASSHPRAPDVDSSSPLEAAASARPFLPHLTSSAVGNGPVPPRGPVPGPVNPLNAAAAARPWLPHLASAPPGKGSVSETPVPPAVAPIRPMMPHLASSHPGNSPAPEPPASIPTSAPAPVQSTNYSTDQKDINQAQKHAKWAISALNFEDVPTAVKELRNALAMLGAQ
ncbi:vacuolar sorting-associated vta1 [Fusarium longipes]|uniref:Vacuolar sorting-associated vta1 n=1 Tax=Fusarium longipes TaxID=694270 RepID=A0A395T5G7_9HYPO|nr:vacuolar sorting-associated vta1 [Fusarium longipes]